MSLDNLVGISLETIDADVSAIQHLLSAAERNISDAHVIEISAENRFDAAYKAIMQLANAALQVNGYRTLTSKPGHHMTMIQTLSQTVGLEKSTVITLDALRKQRNIADYSGGVVPSSAVNENTNRLLRQYFPKGTDLALHSQAKLNAVARRLNERPRKTLEYEMPAEKFNACVASIG